MTFTVSNVTASATGSTFAATNGGGAASSTTGNSNKIVVTADRLYFTQQPTSASVGIAMSPAVTVVCADVNNNTDIDYPSTTIGIIYTGKLTGSPVQAGPTAGVATFSSLTHSATGNGLILTAAASGFTNVVINTFSITSEPDGSYRSTSAGTWSGATWDRLVSGAWQPGYTPANNTTSNVYIRHAITGGSISPANVIVESTGTFTITASTTVGTSL